jgi:hypothetical protein
MTRLGDVHRVPLSHCPNCGQKLTACGMFDDSHAPVPGNIALCFCGHVLVFGDDLVLREPNDQEIIDLAGDPALLQAQRMLSDYRDWQKQQRKRRKRSRR